MQDGKEQIRERAYALWEEDGRPDGRDQDHWQRAAEELGEAGQTDGGDAAAATEGEQLQDGSAGLGSGLQPGGTTPGGGPAAGAGSIGTGGGSTAGAASGSGKRR